MAENVGLRLVFALGLVQVSFGRKPFVLVQRQELFFLGIGVQ